MKTRIIALYSLLIIGFVLSLLSTLVHGHGGRTADDGCHNDGSTNTRHCHTGDSSSGRSNPSCDKPVTPTPPSAPPNPPADGSCSGASYDRDEWGYNGPPSFSTNVGYYSGVTCTDGIDADHVVPLKDAHDSGGCSWSSAQKAQFANDRDNLVPSCSRINRSKGASLPAEFIRLSSDGSGVDFVFPRANMCAYLIKYKQVKGKYGLSLTQNDSAVFQACSIGLP